MEYSWWENVIQIVVLKSKKTNALNKKRLDTARTETSKNRLINKSINQHNKTNHLLPIRPLIKLRTGLKIKLENLILRGTREMFWYLQGELLLFFTYANQFLWNLLATVIKFVYFQEKNRELLAKKI